MHRFTKFPRNFVATCLSGACLFFLLANTANAECCECNLKSDPAKIVCVQILGNDCANAVSSVGANTTVTCTGNIVPEGKCKKITDSNGICNILTNVGTINSEPEIAAASAPAREPFKATVPTLNINIPGLEFASNIGEDGGYVTLPYISQYVSAFYRFAAGAALIAAALMVIYGGFLYLLGSTIQSVSNGKEKIKEALIGMVLVLTSYLLLTIVNPEAAQPLPLTIRIAKYDDSFLNSVMGDPRDYPPVDNDQLTKEIGNAVTKLLGSGGSQDASSGSTQGSSPPAQSTPSAGSQPTPSETNTPSAGSQPTPSETNTPSAGSQPTPSAQPASGIWETASDGTRLWPNDCGDIKLVGKSNAPGSYTAILAALAKKDLAEKSRAVIEASKTGTFYARGIENNKKIELYTDPPSEIPGKKDKWGKPLKRDYRSNMHLYWILNEFYHVRKWRTEKMLSTEACGPNMPRVSLKGDGLKKFQQYFNNPKNGNLLSCFNSAIEILNNTYLKAAQCFDIKSDQCSFSQNWRRSPYKEVKGITRDELIAGFKAGAYPPGTTVSSEGGTGHQWAYVGGLGLGYEVLEWGGGGGDAYNSPAIVIEPGFFGEERTTLGRGIKTSKSVVNYINTQNYPSFTAWLPN